MTGQTEDKATVSICKLDNYTDSAAVLDAMRRGLVYFGGMDAFVRRGAKVLLKVNLVAPSHPDLAVTTHPEIVRGVIRLVKECGGICYVGDGPGVGDTLTAAKTSGIAQVVQEEGAELLDFRETAVFGNGNNRVAKHISLAKQLADMDVLITLPKLKTHCQMAFTGALKNQFGLIPGAAKGQFHFRFQNRIHFSDLIVDINRTAHPSLAIMDAVIGMEGPGPSGGTPRKIGALICGDDLAAVDSVACALIGLSIEDVPVSMAARRSGYGKVDMASIDVVGASIEEMRVDGFKLVKAPLNIMRILPLPQFMLRWIRAQVAPRPVIIESKCKKCRRCEKGCPVNPPAILPMADGGPVLDDKRCIRCYCCHEFCPVKAIELKKSLLARIFNVEAVATWASRVTGRIASIWR